MLLNNLYWYRAREIIKVSDGDTFVAVLDRGFDDRKEVRVRLAGINAYEKSGRVYASFARYCEANNITLPDKEERKKLALLGQQESARSLEGKEVLVHSLELDRKDVFGRVLAEVYADETLVNQHLLDLNLAIAYNPK